MDSPYFPPMLFPNRIAIDISGYEALHKRQQTQERDYLLCNQYTIRRFVRVGKVPAFKLAKDTEFTVPNSSIALPPITPRLPGHS